MTVPSYTEEDEQLLQKIIDEWCTSDCGLSPKLILAALSSAGRLVPPESGETAECGCPVRYAVARITDETPECTTRKAAERLAKYIDEEYGDG